MNVIHAEACSKEEIRQHQDAQNSTQMIQDRKLDVNQMKLAYFIDGKNLQLNLVRKLFSYTHSFIDLFRYIATKSAFFIFSIAHDFV